MMIMNRKISTQLLTASKYGFAGFGKKRDKVKNDLPKYDVVIAGGNLGALLSAHIDGAVHEKASIFVAYDNANLTYPTVRPFYEKAAYCFSL
jgi:hypothetical protein